MEYDRNNHIVRKALLIFFLTCVIVVLLGLGALAGYRYLMTRQAGLTEADMTQEPVSGTAAETAGSFGEAVTDTASASNSGAERDAVGDPGDEQDTEQSPDGAEEPADETGEDAEPDPFAGVEEDFFTRRMETAVPDTVTMAFAGDILFDASYSVQNRILAADGDVSQAVGDTLLERMRAVDIMMVNNEFPYTDSGSPQAEKTFTFHAMPRAVRQLKEMGVDLAGIANNHTFDYGERGLLDTLDTLDRAGVGRVGAGRNIEEASHPMVYLAGGMRIAVIAATQLERYANPNTRGATAELPGVFRCMDDTRLCEVIRKAKEENDFVVVFIHWGNENEVPLHWSQTNQGPDITAAGADLVIGAHSHCLQPLGYVNDVPIVYSLGNFLFNSKTLDTCLIECDIKRLPEGGAHLTSLRFLPCIQSGCKVRFAEDGDKTRILDYMRSISPGVTIADDGEFLRTAE